MDVKRSSRPSAWRDPGVRLAAVLSTLWLASWMLAWCPAEVTGPLGLPWLTWSHIVLGAAAVASTIWAVGALGRWEGASSTHSK